MTLGEYALLGEFRQHHPGVLEDRWPVSHHAGLVLEVAVTPHLLPQWLQLGGEVSLRLGRYARHARSFIRSAMASGQRSFGGMIAGDRQAQSASCSTWSGLLTE